jgi:hypothetical protein
MRLTSVVTLSAALLLSSAAVAKENKLASNEQPSATTAYQAPAEAPAATEKKVCKRLATSGTRMEERVCLTKKEWQKVEEEAK